MPNNNLRDNLLFRGGTILIPKNRDSDSLAHFGGIGTGLGIKGIVRRIKQESFFNSQFLITRTGGRNRDSQFLIFEESCHLYSCCLSRDNGTVFRELTVTIPHLVRTPFSLY